MTFILHTVWEDGSVCGLNLYILSFSKMSGALLGDYKTSVPLVMEPLSCPEDQEDVRRGSFDPLDGSEEFFNSKLDDFSKEVL